MNSSSLAFRLFVEPRASCPPTDGRPEVIELSGPTSLDVEDRQLATVCGAQTGAVVLEPIHFDNQSRLAMTISDGGLGIRVNGLAAGPVSVLGVRDVVEFPDDGPVIHIALHFHPYLGPALADHMGRECPLCTTQIGPESRVLVCPHCQTVLHDGALDDSAGAPEAAESLECAKTTQNCPCCENALAREEGYVHVPEI